MNNLNISDEKLNLLLQMAGQKLGQNPKELKEKLQSNGGLDSLVNGLDPKAASQINTLLQNPKMLEAMLGNEKVKNMIAGLAGSQK